MSANPTLQELLEVQRHFGLPSPALVEKDWHVIKALAAVMAVEAAPFRVVFAGGTALARAHKLVRRMSEDVDFKIVLAAGNSLSQNARHKQLSQLRTRVTAALLDAGFRFDPTDPGQLQARDSSQYAIYRLPYETTAGALAELRPAIQIELTYTTLRRPAQTMPVASFVADAYGRACELPAISCIGITETAAEKFVSLTRRTGMELAGVSRDPDPMLVRHIYDLHIIRAGLNFGEVAALAREIAAEDAQDRKYRYPTYREDIEGETRKALTAIENEPLYRQRYAAFMRAMVYGEKPEFEQAFATVKNLATFFLEQQKTSVVQHALAAMHSRKEAVRETDVSISRSDSGELLMANGLLLQQPLQALSPDVRGGEENARGRGGVPGDREAPAAGDSDRGAKRHPSLLRRAFDEARGQKSAIREAGGDGRQVREKVALDPSLVKQALQGPPQVARAPAPRASKEPDDVAKVRELARQATEAREKGDRASYRERRGDLVKLIRDLRKSGRLAEMRRSHPNVVSSVRSAVRQGGRGGKANE